LTASGIFWKEDEVKKKRERRKSGTKDLSLHNTNTSSSPYIYGYTKRKKKSGKKETNGRGGILLKERQVEGWDSLQDEISRRGAISLNMVLLCTNCCMQKKREISDVGYSQNCR
jgi:hypothetical protein